MMAHAQQFDPGLYQSMRWRMIGPFRGGRTVGAAGVPGQPNVFYIGVNNGGVWKTTDYGRSWNPIFDDQPTGSIGTLAVAPSNPDILYVGSGEGLQRPDLAVGDGVFKSTDAGQTWKHMGLDDAQQIGAILIHPQDPDLVWVAVLGHPYGPNQQRGVFQSTDGGESWRKSLYIDENTGAIALAMDPSDPDTIYADLWAARQGPWENAAWQGTTSGLYKSTDGGANWRRLSRGLPGLEQGLGRIGLAIAPNDNRRIYASVDARQGGGIYRSDDAGESWQLVNQDRRLWGRGSDFAELKVHPRDRDTLLVGNIALYRSHDAGKTFTSIKGAPGGDDYHAIWINPDNPEIILVAADQGAVITVNGGETWSSWYNQPTAQLYHVSTDNQFPYYVYGGQQESGAIATASRGHGGQISFRDWHGVGADEYAYVAPDPLDPNIVYGGRVMRFDRRTGQSQNVAPEAVRSGDYRILRSMPLLFSAADPQALYFAANVLFKTRDGGQHWQIISPDLSRQRPEVPESIGIFRTPEMAEMPRRGVIYALAPSPLEADTIWAGTDDGLVHLTRDGGRNWQEVTPGPLTAWSKVSQIEAGHFDSRTAYLAINRIRLDDMRPRIYRTHDGGTTWQAIVRGLPENGPVNAVREDPVRPGLLYAGTEREVFVSFNDGDEWQPLRLNMPASSIRDIVVQGDDLVAGTHGRSIWILDNLTPLRQINAQAAAADAFLFEPQTAYRVRWNMFSDTPLPPEEPGGENPPDGAMIDYYLKEDASEVSLEILDGQGNPLRRFSSADEAERLDPQTLAHPTYWIRPPEMLSARAGMQRFVWDLHYPPPEGVRRSYPIAAVYRKTPSGPLGPWVHPGDYSVRLTVDGQTFIQPLAVRLDPRVRISDQDLQEQFDHSMACYASYGRATRERDRIASLRSRIEALLQAGKLGDLEAALTALDRKAAAIAGRRRPRRPDLLYSAVYKEPSGEETLAGSQQNLLYLMALLQGADAKPTSQAMAAVQDQQRVLDGVVRRWNDLIRQDLPAINRQLEERGLSTLNLQ